MTVVFHPHKYVQSSRSCSPITKTRYKYSVVAFNDIRDVCVQRLICHRNLFKKQLKTIIFNSDWGKSEHTSIFYAIDVFCWCGAKMRVVTAVMDKVVPVGI